MGHAGGMRCCAKRVPVVQGNTTAPEGFAQGCAHAPLLVQVCLRLLCCQPHVPHLSASNSALRKTHTDTALGHANGPLRPHADKRRPCKKPVLAVNSCDGTHRFGCVDFVFVHAQVSCGIQSEGHATIHCSELHNDYAYAASCIQPCTVLPLVQRFSLKVAAEL